MHRHPDTAYEPRNVAGNGAGADDRSLTDLVSDTTRHAQDLFRGEVELAKAEMRSEVRTIAIGASMGVAAAVIGGVALILLGQTVAIALDTVLVSWLAWLLAALLFAAIAGGLALSARQRVAEADPVPSEAIKGAKEDLEWVRTHR